MTHDGEDEEYTRDVGASDEVAQSKTEKVNGRNSETTEAKYNDYTLSLLIFDSFTQLFVSFTALCPNLNPISFDVATSQKRRDVK